MLQDKIEEAKRNLKDGRYYSSVCKLKPISHQKTIAQCNTDLPLSAEDDTFIEQCYVEP